MRHVTGSLWNVSNAWECILSVIRYSYIYFPDIPLFSLQFKIAENYFPAQMRKLYFAAFKLGSNSYQHWIHISHRETSYEESPNTSNIIHHFDLILICSLQLLVFKVCCWSLKQGISLFLCRPGFWDQIALGERLAHSHFQALSNQPCTLSEFNIVVEIFVAK